MVYFVIVLAVAAGLAMLLLALGYRVLKKAHARPPVAAGSPSPAVSSHGHGTAHGHDTAQGHDGAAHPDAAAASGHSGMERAVLQTIGRTLKLLVRMGVRIGPMMMLTVRGRKSGVARTNPVDLFEQNGRRWLVATHEANASWVLNLRAAGEGKLARGRRNFTFTATELSQQDAGTVLKEVLGPRLAKPVGGFVLRQTLGVPSDAPLAEFVDAAALHPVFELTASQGSAQVRARVGNEPGTADQASARRPKLPYTAIGVGALIAVAHASLGAAGVMTATQWISGVAIGLLVAGVGNHLRIFGRH